MSRVPPSRPPPAPAATARIRLPRRPQHVENKPIKTKQGEDAESATGAEPVKSAVEAEHERAHDPTEHAKMAEGWGAEGSAVTREEKEALASMHEGAEKEEKAAAPKGFLKQIKPALNKPPLQQKKPVKDGFEQQKAEQAKPGTAQAQQAQAARSAAPAAPVKAAAPIAPPTTTPPNPSKPPDAFTVLHAAQDPGVYFKEEGHNGPAEQEDPELSAAIEEAIRLLFGVRGILRVSGGRNQAQAPVIVVVTTQGFGEAQLKLVPPKVHKFETLLAVPYDLLPLKKDRF